jgi:hypothetical protein
MQDPLVQNTINASIQLTSIIKPDYASSFENAGKQFKVFWKILLLIGAVNLVIGYIFQIPFYTNIINTNQSFESMLANLWQYILLIIVMIIVSEIFSYGYILATLKAARSEKPSILDLFRPFKIFFPVIFSFILLCMIIFAGFMLLIIPGIIFACRLAFVPYLVVDKNKGVFSAISESWKMTKGHFWTIFLIGLTTMGVGVIIFFTYFMVFTIASGGDIFQTQTPNMTAGQIFFNILCLPIGLFIALVVGSLYHAIKIEKNMETQTNFKTPASNNESPVNNGTV